MRLGRFEIGEVADENRGSEEVVDGDVEEALDLRGVEVDEESAVGAGGDEQVGDELGGDGDAGTVFAILARIAVVGNDGGDAAGRGAAERVLHDEQLHEVLVSRIAGGLDEEDVGAADVFEQLEVNLAIREALELGLADRHAEELADLFGERRGWQSRRRS